MTGNNALAVKRCLAATAIVVASMATAHATVVSGFDATYVADGRWYTSDTRPGGSVSIEVLAGPVAVGAPLPSGAAKLTTSSSTAAKAEVGVRDAYGRAGDILRSLDLQFSYFKVGGGDPAPAPSIKLTFVNPAVTTTSGPNRGFMTLIWEAYTQTPALANPLADQWVDVNIDFNNGLFWGTDGFGHIGSGGGAPYRSLANWAAALNSDFANASLFLVSVGLGSNNPSQIGYFDDVRISHSFGNGFSANYDFEAAAAVPEPGALALAGLALMGIVATRRRRG